MQTIPIPIIDRIARALSQVSRIRRHSRIRDGVLLLGAFLNFAPVVSATLPGTYSVALGWNRSPNSTVTGYRVYSGVVSGVYTSSVAVGNVTTNIVPNLVDGITYFFAVTAYNASGKESLFSSEISLVPGPATISLHTSITKQPVLTVAGLIGHTYEIQASQDLKTWSPIGTVTPTTGSTVEVVDLNAANFPTRFYRTREP